MPLPISRLPKLFCQLGKIPANHEHPTIAINATVYKVLAIGQGSLAVMAKPEISAQISALDAIAKVGTTHLVSLLAHDEANNLGLQHEESLCASVGMNFINFPIEDMTLPLHRIAKHGGHVVIHCRAGIGRSGMLACAVIMHEGIAASTAIDIVSNARGIKIPDTEEQRRFIHQLESLIDLRG